MKKIVSLVLSLMLCMTFALAEEEVSEAVPSKTTKDLTVMEVVGDNIPADSGFFIAEITDDQAEEYQEVLNICHAEIAKLTELQNEAADIETYFGEVTTADGSSVSLKEMLGLDESAEIHVSEFMPIVAGHFDVSYGDVTANLVFATPFAEGQKVLVMIGIVTVLEDGTTQIEWTVYEGVGIAADNIESAGCIQVTFDPEIVEKMQDDTAVMAIVSE